jgi:antitoxin ParD1/3/4
MVIDPRVSTEDDRQAFFRRLKLSLITIFANLRYQPKIQAVNVSLTPELEEFIQKKVTSGRYTSASEVVREALRLLEDQEKVIAAQRKEFRAELERRTASLQRGEGLDGEKIFAAIRKKSSERRKKSE